MTEAFRDPLDKVRPISRATIARAGVAAIIIGASLTLINQWNAIKDGSPLSILPALLVFQTPFLVVLASQALAIAQAKKDFAAASSKPARRKNIVQTMFSHNIPARAFLLGGVAGSINTVIVTIKNLITTGQAAPLPGALITQAFTLPIVFGIISQSLAYKRAMDGMDGMSSAHLQPLGNSTS